MASYQEKMVELEKLGTAVIAATVEDKETAAQMAQEEGLTIPLAYGITEDDVLGLDPWWAEDHHGRYLQPMEFLILGDGSTAGSMYSSGPIGRMGVEQVLISMQGRERRRIEQEGADGAPAAASP